MPLWAQQVVIGVLAVIAELVIVRAIWKGYSEQ